MSDNDRDLDLLLRRNAEQQLAGFDWEEFGRRVSNRLMDAHAPIGSWQAYARRAAMAALVALTAGVLLWAVLCATRRGPKEPVAVMIETAHGTAEVSFPPADKRGRGEATILSSDKPRREPARSSWCIIAQHEPPGGKDAQDDEASDILCLF